MGGERTVPDMKPSEEPRIKPWLPRSPPPSYLLTNVSLVDVETGRVHHGASISLAEGVITDVSTDSASPLTPSSGDVQTVDLKGKYIMPGLIDCHVHLTATPGELSLKDLMASTPAANAYRTTYVARTMLMRGFTTARDTGGATYALRDAIKEFLIAGPRLFICGHGLSQTGGHGDARQMHQGAEFTCCGGHAPSMSRVVDGVPGCLAAARDELRQGADFIKIMVGGGVASPADPLDMLQFTPEEIRAITTTASNSHTYVTAHAYSCDAIRHAVDNGVMAIEHGNFIDAATAKYCADRDVTITPTLITYHAMSQPPFVDFLPPESQEKNKAVLASGVNALKVCRDNGVMLCFGTDLLAGLHVWQNAEFSLRAQALSSLEILQSATVNAAKLLKMEGKLGTVKKGALADLLFLNGNPLEDVTILDRMEGKCLGIVKDGRVVKSEVDGMKVDAVYATLV